MHIPDGYLSPSTCAVLYGAAVPFWSAALRRVRKLVSTRIFPLLALSSAFSFVIMMFNLPLPGGTTGHATGVAVSAIVLGPWGSILATSVALFTQALFFGDGGITALGANCFNMAIVGSLVASATYRLLARGNASANRRTFAAGAAGYVAINAAAICTAIEFGLQPLLFHDAAGAPLYAPYPIRIALPAMMIGHLTFAGLAELILTAGVVRYLLRSEPALAGRLQLADTAVAGVRRSLRPLWAGLGALMVLTPLGLLAAGTAWGEWSARELADPAAQNVIAAASRGAAPPSTVPAGLQRLASVWTAPLAGYAPPLLRAPAFGYLLSAMFGSGLILLFLLGAKAIAPRAPATDSRA